MVNAFPRYNDDEVKVFHPFFEHCAKEAIKRINLDNDLRVVHHRSFNGITVDFSIERIKSKRIVLLVEVKRTKSAVESTRYRHQALSYRKEADHLCETPYYILTNIENTDLFRYDSNKPRVSSQLIKGSPFSCGVFNTTSLSQFVEAYVDCLCDIISISIEDKGDYDQNLDFLHNHLESKVGNYEEWHTALMPFSFEYIRGAAFNYNQLNEKIKTSNWKAADSYIAAPVRLSEKGRQIDFSHVFKEPYPAPNDTYSFQQVLLDSAYHNGKARGKGDDISEVIYDLLAPRGPGIVETDQELASLLAVLSRIELNRSLQDSEMIADPAAGSGRLLTAAASAAFPEINPGMIWANEIEPYFSEALSLRLGLHFGESISVDNCPRITIENIASLDKENFADTKVVLLNPPYISGIYSKDKRRVIAEAIERLSSVKSKTNYGQIGLEGPFLELIVNLVPDDTIIAAIMPFSLLTRKSKEVQLYRNFLLNEFGLSIVCCYPREGLFENVIKRTCIFVGRKNSNRSKIKWIDISSPIERLDLHKMQQSLLNEQRLFTHNVLDSQYLTNNIESGWINDTKKTAKEWFLKTFSGKTDQISTIFSGIKRGASGNSGSADLSAIPIKKYESLIDKIPKLNQAPAINNAEGLQKYLTKENAPCISPLIIQGEQNYFSVDLIESYISIKEKIKSSGKQAKAPLTFDKVMNSISKDVKMFPEWSVLIPRSVRIAGNIAILRVPYNVSTNFLVVNCQNEMNAITTASWLFSVFGQIQMEFLCNDQEGARKLEKNEISKLHIPNNLNEIGSKFLVDLKKAFESSDPINYKNIQLRDIDKLWAGILYENADQILQESLNYIQDLADERSP